MAPVRRSMAETLTETAIGYPESPLNGPQSGGADPAPGMRLRPTAGQAPPGAGDSPRFALCGGASEALQKICARYTDLLESRLRPPLAEGAVHLIRPDGYVACAVARGDAARIDAYLGGLKGNGESRRMR